ncbi:hypothetical protein [Streptomyces sp. NPDC050535]|uniref:hypothetical protein n=1 Tax=Streptomyces sp. NPDC050535 TaxID=3365626 RepID=UPI00378CA6DE
MARRGGCLTNGCLAVLMLALVLVIGVMVSVRITDSRAENDAQDQLATAVDGTSAELARAAGDGVLLDTEILRAVRSVNKPDSEIRRDGRRVTVTARFVGFVGGGFFGSAQADGCYRFEVVPAGTEPSVSVREVSQRVCSARSSAPGRDAVAVAEDVVAELRTAVMSGGAESARSAAVWETPGIDLEGAEAENGRLTAVAWLSGGTDSMGRDCYEFHAGKKSATAEKVEPEGCYGVS